MKCTRLASLLVLILVVSCAPRLRNEPRPVDDDDTTDVADDDDDDSFEPDDPCCDPEGDGETWRECSNDEAAECVCDQDSWCCSEGWDSSCSDSYVSPCGALTCD